MASKSAFVFLLFILGAGLAFAAAPCASGPFKSACSECTFDISGKMSPGCWEEFEGQGKTCIATSYPKMAFEYEFGDGCPQLDTCVSRLTACKEARKTGNDQWDCARPEMIRCFTVADACAEAANRVCAEGKTEFEAGFNTPAAGEMPENETKPPEANPPTKIPDSYDDGGAALEDFVCGEQEFFIGLLLLLAGFMRKG